MEMILIRHGTTQGNLEKRYVGVTDVPLIDEGIELAKRVSLTLPEVSRVYVSPLTRCRQTADILWENTPKTILQNLIEMDFGPFEGKNHKELLDDERYKRWLDAPLDTDYVEKVTDVAERAILAIREIISEAETHGFERVGIVSHGGVFMSLLAHIARPERDFYGWNLHNCCGYIAVPEGDPLILNVTGTVGGAT